MCRSTLPAPSFVAVAQLLLLTLFLDLRALCYWMTMFPAALAPVLVIQLLPNLQSPLYMLYFLHVWGYFVVAVTSLSSSHHYGVRGRLKVLTVARVPGLFESRQELVHQRGRILLSVLHVLLSILHVLLSVLPWVPFVP